MLSDILGELASSVLGESLAPSTDRGRTRLSLMISVIAISVQIWAFAAVGNPLRGPKWAFGLMMFGLMLAIVALPLSVAYLVRLEDHRVSSGVSAALAAAALLWPLVLMGR